MLLRQESAERADVLSVTGPVGRQDAAPLVHAVEQALARRPRGVVLDLLHVPCLDPEAAAALRDLTLGRSDGRLCVCSAAPGVRSALPGVPLHDDRTAALAAVPDRRGLAGFAVEHGPHGPGQARQAVRECAVRLGLEDESDDLVLVVSEMVTNAVRHGQPPVALDLRADGRSVTVCVCDGSPQPPRPRHADEDAEGGRGMALLEILAAEHGVHRSPPGKTVWARLRRRRSSGS